MIKETCVLVLVTALTAAACTETIPNTTPCRNIPAQGCPVLTNDTECDDPSCAAAYACDNGTWTFDHACPAFDGGHADASLALSDAGSGDAGAGACLDAGFDAPPGAAGGPGCGPLDPPDCPLSRVLACDPESATACNECDSFFACVAGAWIFWGGCSDGGVTLKN
jgi:hypothetical protein